MEIEDNVLHVREGIDLSYIVKLTVDSYSAPFADNLSAPNILLKMNEETKKYYDTFKNNEYKIEIDNSIEGKMFILEMTSRFKYISSGNNTVELIDLKKDEKQIIKIYY